LHRLDIDTRRLVGTLSRDSVWIPIISVAVPTVAMFSVGLWLLFYWSVTLIAPSAGRAMRDLVTQMNPTGFPWVLGVLVAPPVEELLFRGILLHRWSVKWGLRRAILFSSLAFAVLHAAPVGMFVFGCVMAVLYIRSRTLIVPIICHMLNNALGFALADTSLAASSIAQVALWTVASGGLIALFLHKNWPGPEERGPYFAAAPAVGAAPPVPLP